MGFERQCKVNLEYFHVSSLLRRLALDHVKAEFHDTVVRTGPSRVKEEGSCDDSWTGWAVYVGCGLCEEMVEEL